ncbi:MAG: metallophosphoesterase [Polyangiaceae bacterium]|nr:metallophosphoesterase [Polyangiaceae bacterium]
MNLEGFVVSDLHLGDGQKPLEDFRDDEKLASFVESIAKPGKTLFINGDFIDFAQIPPFEVAEPSYLLWDEEASVKKLQLALAAHSQSFDALRRFLEAGADLRIHIGNHDLDLAWPRVQTLLRQRLGAEQNERLQFEIRGSLYHGVHIEHGHAFTPENAPRELEKFIHEWPNGSGKQWLERVWGTDFMLRFYNDLERRYPFADSVKPMATVLWHGVRKKWIGGAEVVHLLKFLKARGLPIGAIAGAVLGEESTPTPPMVAAGFAEPAWQKVILERMSQDPQFRDEIKNSLDALPREDKAVLAQGGRVEVGVQTKPEGAVLGIFREDRELRAAREHLAKPGVTHVVYGHTHAIVNGALDGALYNPGTWLPELDLNSPAVKEKISANGLSLEMLEDQSLYRVKRTVVHIEPQTPNASRVSLVEV